MSFGGREEVYRDVYERASVLFFDVLEQNDAAIQPLLNMLTMPFSSDVAVEHHVFSDAVPAMKQWIDERPMSRLSAQKFAIENLDWANGVEIDRNDIRRQKFDLFDRRIRALAEAAIRNKRNLLVQLLNDSFANLGYDGVPMVADNHPLKRKGTTQSNILHDPLDHDSLQAAVTQLETLVDEEGEFLDMTATHLVTGTDLRFKALELLQNERKANGESNVNRGLVTPLYIKGISAGYWWVMDLGKSIKPFINQEEWPVEFTAKNRPTDDEMFMRKKMQFGADYSGNMGNALWQPMVGSDGTPPTP